MHQLIGGQLHHWLTVNSTEQEMGRQKNGKLLSSLACGLSMYPLPKLPT